MINSTFTLKKSEGGDFSPVPAGMYQVAVKDIEEYQGYKYGTQEPQDQLIFKTEIVEEGEYRGKEIRFFTTLSWNSGDGKYSPSKLFEVFKSVYAFYKKDVDIEQIDTISGEEINDLIGKQISVVVDVVKNKKGFDNNKVKNFLPIKKEEKDFIQELEEEQKHNV